MIKSTGTLKRVREDGTKVQIWPAVSVVKKPQEIAGMLAFWSARRSGTLVDGRINETTDLISGRSLTRYGSGRVGPRVLAGSDNVPYWAFGGSADPASLYISAVPEQSGKYYSWWFVTTIPTQGQYMAPFGTGSSSQLIYDTGSGGRYNGFAGASIYLGFPTGEHVILMDHDGSSGVTRLRHDAGESNGTLQRRSLVGECHIGRHGSNDRPLNANVKAFGILDHRSTDQDLADLRAWRLAGCPI